MALVKYEQHFPHEKQKLEDNIPPARPMKFENPFLNHCPSPQQLGPTDQKLGDNEAISAHKASMEQPFPPEDKSNTDATSLLIEDKLHQPCDGSQCEAMLAVDTREVNMAPKRKRPSSNRNSCSKPDVKRARKKHVGILCSEDESGKIIGKYFTSLIQRPTLYSYDEDKFQETVKRIPSYTILYIIVNNRFFQVLHTDISAMIRILKGMIDSKMELYFMNFLDERSDYKEVKYNLPIAVRDKWVDKGSFIDIKDRQNIEYEVSSDNVKVGCDNTMDVKTETAETNTNMQIHDSTAMGVRTSTDDVTSTQIGGDLHFKYENGSSLKGIVLTIKTPEANHRLDVTIKKHIDDNLLRINAELQDLHAHVTSTDLGSVIITLKVEEGTKLGARWLEKLIKTLLSEDIMTNLPVGTRMEVNIQASLSLKPLSVDIFETTSEIDVNVRNSENETPLHIAAKSGNVDGVVLLMEKGADITSKDCRHHTPLHLAAIAGKTKCIKSLMKFGKLEQAESKEIPNPDCNKPTNYQIVQGLLAAGADINAKDHDSKTPLHFAALSSDLQILNLLLRYKPEVRCLDSMGFTALHLAVMNNNFKLGIQLAKNDQATLHITDTKGNTPLHVMGRRTLAKSISKTMLKVPLPGQDTGETPLQYAAKNGQIESVYTLLKLGADVNETDSKGRTPLHEVIREQVTSSGSIEFGELYARQFIQLYKEQQELNAKNGDGNSPVITAFLSGNHNVASLLIDEGADVNIPNIRGQSVLHVLAKQQKPLPASIKTVLKKGVDINAKDKEGNTPLHLAVNRENEFMSRQLLEKGADVHAVNNLRLSPLDLTNRNCSLKSLFHEYVGTEGIKPENSILHISQTEEELSDVISSEGEEDSPEIIIRPMRRNALRPPARKICKKISFARTQLPTYTRLEKSKPKENSDVS